MTPDLLTQIVDTIFQKLEAKEGPFLRIVTEQLRKAIEAELPNLVPALIALLAKNGLKITK
jgi:hypothetical protein